MSHSSAYCRWSIKQGRRLPLAQERCYSRSPPRLGPVEPKGMTTSNKKERKRKEKEKEKLEKRKKRKPTRHQLFTLQDPPHFHQRSGHGSLFVNEAILLSWEVGATDAGCVSSLAASGISIFTTVGC